MADESNEEPLAEEAAEEVKAVELTADEKKFFVACAAGNKVQIELYIKQKNLNPNLKSAKFGLQPLHLVCGAGAVDCAKVLVASGADTKATDPMGLTPLHWAAGCREPEMIRFLLASGATECINARDEDGSTPLIHAAFANRPGNVAVLLEAGADRTVEDQSGNTAKKWALEKKRGDVLNIFDPPEERAAPEKEEAPAPVAPEPEPEAPTPSEAEAAPAEGAGGAEAPAAEAEAPAPEPEAPAAGSEPEAPAAEAEAPATE